MEQPCLKNTKDYENPGFRVKHGITNEEYF